ncbi:MAG: hypothetical protein K6V36_05275 [Anaerolineae bacterium]|nr:hypothetical protein [Anaerolineae bacterium]
MAAPLETEAVISAGARLAGGQHLVTMVAPEIARTASPGQFAMVRCADSWDPYLRRALPFLRLEEESISFLFAGDDPGLGWLARRPLGERVSVMGPLGRGFDLQPATRRLLLATQTGPVGPLLGLAARALASDLSVSLILEAAAARNLAAIVPGAVEVIPAPAMGFWGVVAEHLTWADQTAIAASVEDLPRWSGLQTLRPGQVECFVEKGLACGLGWCGSCLTDTHRGPRRVCTGGPVFDLRELIG